MQSLLRCCTSSLQALKQAVHLPAAYYSVQVLVPSLGESITDGTICTVLKSAGESVKENEIIAQIETDKVTIDIKAPSDGTILGVVVQEQDTVVPGQLVATVDDAAAKANLIGATPTASASQSAASPAAPAAPVAAVAAAAPAHRIPGIRFPPRMTADGQRISMLPAAEQTAILQAATTHTAPASPAAAAAAPASSAAAAKPAGRVNPAAAFGAAAAGASAVPATPSKFATSVTRLDHMPARRELTDREMELIELGGAAP